MIVLKNRFYWLMHLKFYLNFNVFKILFLLFFILFENYLL